jgi:hypothetical protein
MAVPLEPAGPLSIPSPSLRSYLERLPRGLDSYPEASVKGSVVRAIAVAAGDDAELRGRLPPQIERLIATPPLVSAWIPEVHHCALLLARYEAHHAAGGGWESFEAWAFDVSRTILQGPLYCMLFAVLGPERVLAGVHRRWAAFRRGSSLEAVESLPHGARLRLSYPPHLFPEAGLRAIRTSFRVAALSASARHVTVELDEQTPTSCVFLARWE